MKNKFVKSITILIIYLCLGIFFLISETVIAEDLSINVAKLDPCCKDSLKRIKNNKEVAKLLQGALIATPFIQVFTSNPIDYLITLDSNAWSAWANAIKNTSEISNSFCHEIAEHECYKHDNNPKLYRFWHKMMISFE